MLHPLYKPILDVLPKLIAPLLDDLYAYMSDLLRRYVPSNPGTYEVSSHEVYLELLDSKGEKTCYIKKQSIRFIRDNVIAYQDIAWGDGDIFADYQCSPGVAVDRYKEGHRWHVLISLRETKNRGDEIPVRIVRTIKNGFTHEREDFQTEINHLTRRFSITLTFPRERPPKRVSLIEQNLNRTTPLEAHYIKGLRDGRQRVTWETNKPRLFEAYIMAWEW